MITLLLPVCAYAVMHHPSYLTLANNVNTELSTIANPTIREQMTVPVVLGHIFPVGIMGAMAAIMLAAFIGNHNSYLHSWGCMFIQDIVLPLRKKPLTPQQHIRLLRLSVIGVAVIIFLFSLLFKQTQYIKMFLALTGAIYLGGSGAAVIGGLYWSRGTTLAAWVAVILGMIIAVFGIVIHQIKPGFFINGQWFAFIAMAAASSSYIVLSLLGNTRYNMDKLLHRGKYAVEGDVVKVKPRLSLLSLIKNKCKFSADFTISEKFVYMGTTLFTIVWPSIYVLVILYELFFGTSLECWISFWHFFVWFVVGLIPCVTLWFAIGGIKDLKELFVTLRTAKRDDSDNGTVSANQNN
jgi:SSS family solute:Na+ symporter